DVPLLGGNITFSLLTTQPHLRPGYNDFYKTPALQEMVQAAQVRIHMKGQYHTGAVGVNQRHRHFVISEITISGRCECHGHADQCDTSMTPYRCMCLPASHTVGNNMNTCPRCSQLVQQRKCDACFQAGQPDVDVSLRQIQNCITFTQSSSTRSPSSFLPPENHLVCVSYIIGPVQVCSCHTWEELLCFLIHF
ncbi:hypothetical protein AMECASPLE_024915, partial [Ameca splendens]